ncbi:glycosyltransferase family 2 protein [Panacibacter ginsenosidivorans]|uniref:Glycosyltransferase family 2 protein n=1 Tax=Panacibacter ginsenosidivorans TaxID=1813871 RepID=A0A5B8VBI4_9BACT|nr:glycosyltransferase family 2 protein [Panacibacter ginsenosidivorans]QEC68363.1 glycosyltransferase family 2 protein [Panacibacter ginsenosidivorans]
MNLSVIIVSYNVKYFLEQCLCAVERAIANIRSEVIVVDNNSSDGTVEYLQQKYPWVNFVCNEKNEGFAKANNKALSKCNGEFVLYLNPDTIIPENILVDSLAFFKTHNDAGAIGVHMIDGRGVFLPESKRAYPSPLVAFFKLSGLSALFPSSGFFNKYALGNLDKNTIHEVDVLSGAFMMVRKSILQELSGFDESFFMYGEDIDLSYRIQQLGKKNYYLGNLNMIHFKGESTGNSKRKHTRIFYNAMNVFVTKHYTGINAWALKIFLYTGIFLRAVISFLGLPIKIIMNDIRQALKEDQVNVYLVGDASSAEEAKRIMLKHKLQKTFKGSLLIEKRDIYIPTKGSEIIFCTGALSFADTIGIITKYPKKNKYMWHGLDSNSIVFSTDKNECGTVYSIEEVKSDIKNRTAEPEFISGNCLRYADSDKNVQVSNTTKA